VSLRVSEAYADLTEKAHWSHQHNRNVFHITEADVTRARLFAYGFRAQTIGAFSATRAALRSHTKAGKDTIRDELLDRSFGLLQQLEAQAIHPVPSDFRALISTLYYYNQWTVEALAVLEKAVLDSSCRELEKIKDLLVQNMESVTNGDGLHVASDSRVPEQAYFVVPDLDIVIVPLVYGDHHSWNVAHLRPGSFGVSVHRHRKGAEIHLGWSPVNGITALGENRAAVKEGYAMPVPPMTSHGFANLSGHEHFLPFIFGSLVMSGWGIFFDVERQSSDISRLSETNLQSGGMNGSIYLERALFRAANGPPNNRELLIPAWRAGSSEIGGLELSITRIDTHGVDFTSDQFKIISVQQGAAKFRIGQIEKILGVHDHCGIPAGITSHIAQAGGGPLVILEATISPLHESSAAVS
jgi:hypothetical protein